MYPDVKTGIWLALLVVQLLLPLPSFAAGPVSDLELRNVAEPQGSGDTWKWRAFITGKADKINQITCVTYTLHPTFPKPVQKICSTKNPKYPFELDAVGWGTFSLRAKVEFRDGPPQELNHTLDFSDAARPPKD